MKLRSGQVIDDQRLELTHEEYPTTAWRDDGVLRWVDLEGFDAVEIKERLAPLGVEPWVVESLLDPVTRHAIPWVAGVIGISLTVPAAWSRSSAKDIAVIIVAETVVTIHADPMPRLDVFVDRWKRASSIRTSSSFELVLEYVEFLLQEDIAFYYDIAAQARTLGTKVDAEPMANHLDAIVDAERRASRLAEVWFDNEFAVRGLRLYLPGLEEQAGAVDRSLGRFADTLGIFKQGIALLDKRLDDLHGQYDSELQAQTDKRLRVLTVISAVFLPLTLIAGVYGMNFENMPELHVEHAYFVALGIMLVTALGMLAYFYRKGWLR